MKKIIIFLLLTPLLTYSQEDNNTRELINLARTEISAVSVSTVNGQRSAHNQYYGAVNLFDADSNIINGIIYTTWLTEPIAGPHWVNIDFSVPVKINKVVVILKGDIEKTYMPNPKIPGIDFLQGKLPDRWPEDYSIDIEYSNNGHVDNYMHGPLPILANRNTHVFDNAMVDVNALTFIFPSTHGIEVQELQVFGTPMEDTLLIIKNPTIRTDKPEIEKIGRTFLYGNVFDGIIKGYTKPEITRNQDQWKYSIIMDNAVKIHLTIDKQGRIVDKWYEVIAN